MPIPLILLAAAAIKYGIGTAQKKRGERDAARNVRPELDIAGPYENLLSMYENAAQFGIDRGALDMVTQNQQSAFANGLDTLLQMGGSPDDVSKLFSQYADTFNSLAITDSQMKWNKIEAVAGATDRLYNAKRDEFLYNEDAPYKDKAQLASARQQAGYQMQMSAFDTALSALSYGTNKNYLPDPNKPPPSGGRTTAQPVNNDSRIQIEPQGLSGNGMRPVSGGSSTPTVNYNIYNDNSPNSTLSPDQKQVLDYLSQAFKFYK